MVAEAGFFALGLLLVAFAGGAIGAAVGGMAALSLAGLAIVVGEVGNQAVAAAPGDPAATGLTELIGYGPALGPHVAFAGGIAAAAYVGRRERPASSFPYHGAKNVYRPLGVDPTVLLAGGAFGVLGYWLAALVTTIGLPVDPVMTSVVLTGLIARVAFGYPILGGIDGDLLDMTPYERGDVRTALGGAESGDEGRPAVEPWAPQQYGWQEQAILGLVVGLFAAYVAHVTGSSYLAFGIAAASTAFLVVGERRLPITYHIALPASIAALSLPGASVELALLSGAVFGVLSGVFGELAGRVLYAHADTHVDPGAAAIVLATLLIGLLTTVGVFEQAVIPAL